MEWIDFRQLPPAAGGFSQLFFDFLHNFEEVRGFYSHNFRSNQSFDVMMQSLDRRALDRSTLAAVLTEENRSFGSSSKTFDNIALLEKPGTYAVVTGQQVGLFGGPLYTVFKTLTAIKLVAKLSALFPENRFVPVFWVEGEDHDFAEMNHVTVLDGANTPVKIEYLPGGTVPERNLGPIGELVFDASLDQTMEQLSAALPKSEFTEKLVARLKGCYSPGRSFLLGFTSWMNYLFEEHGLVFISSNHPRLKGLLSPLFLREITEFPKSSQLVIEQSAELEKNYHAQIKAKSLNLFMFHKGGRYLIEPRETDFSLKGTRHFLQKDDLLRMAQENPASLSPNVVLRPIAQDTLLPTVAYVAGPSEIAYYAQLKPVYEYFGVPQPVIYPRASASFVEGGVQRAMEKYGLSLEAFFEDADSITRAVLAQIAEVNLDELFGTSQTGVRDVLNELKFGLQEIDPTLLGTLEATTLKIEGSLQILREKTMAAQKRRNEVAVRQIEKAANGMLPGDSLQERVVNVVHYLNKYGPDLIRRLYDEVDINTFKHQMITLTP